MTVQAPIPSISGVDLLKSVLVDSVDAVGPQERTMVEAKVDAIGPLEEQ